METIQTLLASGRLLATSSFLEDHEQHQRLMYFMPRVRTWAKANLMTLESDGFYENALSPKDQLRDICRNFLLGADLSNERLPPHSMQPIDSGVWELRTPDLRLFGWAYRKNTIIVSAIDTKQRCSQLGLYSEYRDQAVQDRDSLNLKPPSHVTGDLNYVF